MGPEGSRTYKFPIVLWPGDEKRGGEGVGKRGMNREKSPTVYRKGKTRIEGRSPTWLPPRRKLAREKGRSNLEGTKAERKKVYRFLGLSVVHGGEGERRRNCHRARKKISRLPRGERKGGGSIKQRGGKPLPHGGR